MANTLNVPNSLEHLAVLRNELETAVERVLAQSSLRYDDINAGSREFFFVGWNPWRWAPLEGMDQGLLKPARAAADRWRLFAQNAIRVAAPEREKSFTKLNYAVDRIIERPDDTHGAPADSIEEIRERALDEIKGQHALLEGLPTAHGTNERLLVADTSALLDRPDLQNWRPDEGDWTIISLPQVLSELDEKKRDPRTREAADKVIRQFNDFDRRGNTLTGVPVAGRVRYREVTAHADMDRTLPWLRRDVPDDLIIAGALELAWQDLAVRVAIVASDRNVKNKARVAGLTCLAPSEL